MPATVDMGQLRRDRARHPETFWGDARFVTVTMATHQWLAHLTRWWDGQPLDRRRRLGGPASRLMGTVIWSAPTGKTYKTLAEQAQELVREG